MIHPAVQETAAPPDASSGHRTRPQPLRYSLLETFRLIRSDISFRCAYEHKRFTWLTALRMLRHPGVACVIRYRMQCFFYSNGMTPLGWCMKFLNLIMYGVEIDERARIGPGLYMTHAVTILVTEDVIIGERCVLLGINTIGHSPFLEPGRDPGPLVIGNDVTFGAGACAYGNVAIGDKCLIGVNSVVDRSFPAGSLVFGVPARMATQRRGL